LWVLMKLGQIYHAIEAVYYKTMLQMFIHIQQKYCASKMCSNYPVDYTVLLKPRVNSINKNASNVKYVRVVRRKEHEQKENGLVGARSTEKGERKRETRVTGK